MDNISISSDYQLIDFEDDLFSKSESQLIPNINKENQFNQAKVFFKKSSNLFTIQDITDYLNLCTLFINFDTKELIDEFDSKFIKENTVDFEPLMEFVKKFLQNKI